VAYADVAGPEPNQIRLPKLLVQMASPQRRRSHRKITEKAVKSMARLSQLRCFPCPHCQHKSPFASANALRLH